MAPEEKIENNSDIEKALQEFEKASREEENSLTPAKAPSPHEVSGVSFETDNYRAPKFQHEATPPKVVQLVMKYSGGVVKDQKQAEYVLLAFVIIALIVSLFLFFGGGAPELELPEEDIFTDIG